MQNLSKKILYNEYQDDTTQSNASPDIPLKKIQKILSSNSNKIISPQIVASS
jgi:hypothetical protein